MTEGDWCRAHLLVSERRSFCQLGLHSLLVRHKRRANDLRGPISRSATLNLPSRDPAWLPNLYISLELNQWSNDALQPLAFNPETSSQRDELSVVLVDELYEFLLEHSEVGAQIRPELVERGVQSGEQEGVHIPVGIRRREERMGVREGEEEGLSRWRERDKGQHGGE